MPKSARRTLGVDIDGVLADFVGAYAALCTRMTGKPVKTVAHRWDWTRDDGITPEDEKLIWAEIKANPEWWLGLHPLPEALDAIATLNTLRGDHNCYYITNRPFSAKGATERWLLDHGADCPTVVVTNEKGPVCRGVGIDLFVDDRPENVVEVEGALGKAASIYLYAQPWNRTVREEWALLGEDRYKVVTSLVEVWEEVGER